MSVLFRRTRWPFQFTLTAGVRSLSCSLCRIFTDTGHGAGKTSGQTIAEGRDKLAFLALALGLEVVVRPAATPAGPES
jgi:hypothetical protein